MDIDQSVGRLIGDGTIASSERCPYRVFTTALIEALVLGPEAQQTAKESERVRISELNAALKHIDRALKTLAPSREEIKHLAVREDEELFARLAEIVAAEAQITNVVKFLNENLAKNYGTTDLTNPSKRGAKGDLRLHGIVSSCADAWEILIGLWPGKNNLKFHNLLEAAATTVLGPLDHEPNWEWQIVAARLRKEEIRQKK